MPFRFKRGYAQKESTFFTKLLPEIRRQIFTELFGESHVHILFCDRNKKFTRDGHPVTGAPKWHHCVCRKGPNALPHKHSEKTHKWCYLQTNILFTCKWAYQSGIAQLYRTNTFAFEQTGELYMFQHWIQPHQKNIRFLDLRLDVVDNKELSYSLRMAPFSVGGYGKGTKARVRITTHSDHYSGFKYSPLAMRRFAQELKQVMAFSQLKLHFFLPDSTEIRTMVEGHILNGQSWPRLTFTFESKETVDSKEGPDSDDESNDLFIFPQYGDF